MRHFDLQHISVVLILMALSGLGGYYFASTRVIPTPPKASVTLSNPIFDQQTAVVQAKITQRKDSSIIIENSKKATGELALSKGVVIYKLSPDKTISTPNTNPESIPLNQEVLIQLELKNDHYEVIAISDIPNPVPPPIKINASQSAKLR